MREDDRERRGSPRIRSPAARVHLQKMGCLRNGAILVLSTFLGTLIGYRLGDSLLPVPGWLVRLFVRDDRVDSAVDLAQTAGKVWGGINGAWSGFLIGAILVAFLLYRARRR